MVTTGHICSTTTTGGIGVYEDTVVDCSIVSSPVDGSTVTAVVLIHRPIDCGRSGFSGFINLQPVVNISNLGYPQFIFDLLITIIDYTDIQLVISGDGRFRQTGYFNNIA